MGLIRKTLFVGSGGFVSPNSKKQRVAKQQIRLQKQTLKAMQQTQQPVRVQQQPVQVRQAPPPKRARPSAKTECEVVLDRIANALVSCGLTERARYGRSTVEGVPAEAQMWLKDDDLNLQVSLFADAAVARQAEQAISVAPGFATGFSEGSKSLSVVDHTLCRLRAVGEGTQLEAARVADIVRAFEQVASAPPEPIEEVGATPREAALSVAYSEITPTEPLRGPPDPLEQLRKLGELRDAGVVSDEEFEAKKAELLGRI